MSESKEDIIDINEPLDKFTLHIKNLKNKYKKKCKQDGIDFDANIFNKILGDVVKEVSVLYDDPDQFTHFYKDMGAMEKTADAANKISIAKTLLSFHLNISYTLAFQILGDTIGYNNGKWEFNNDQINPGFEYTNELIYEYIELGGLIEIDLTGWLRSDDSIMYQATFEVLLDTFYKIDNSTDITNANNDTYIISPPMSNNNTINEFGQKIQKKYIEIIPSMENRHPGNTVMRSLGIQKNIKWDTLPYSSEDIGSGASMRSGCIGLFYCGIENRLKLIALATECARITHNSAIAIYGSIVAALFTAFALERIDINYWPSLFIDLYKTGIIDDYVKKSRPHEYEQFARDKILFYGQWEKYVTMRFTGKIPRSDLRIFKNPVTRIKYFAENFSKGHIDFPGANSDDSVIIAYDSVMSSKANVEKNIIYSILHIGDSDTIGSIALSWQRAYYNNLPIYKLMDGGLFLLENYNDVMQLRWSHKNFMISYEIFMNNIFDSEFIFRFESYLKLLI